jgi:hypothetical protein
LGGTTDCNDGPQLFHDRSPSACCDHLLAARPSVCLECRRTMVVGICDIGGHGLLGFDDEIHPARGYPPSRPDRPSSTSLGVRHYSGNRLFCRFCADILDPCSFREQACPWLGTSRNVSRPIGGKDPALLGRDLQFEHLLAGLVADRRDDLQRIRLATDPGVDATHMSRRAVGRLLVGTSAQFYSVYSRLEICRLAFSLLPARRRDNHLDLSADSSAVATDSGPLADGSDGRDLHLEVLNLLQVGNVATIFLSKFSLHRQLNYIGGEAERFYRDVMHRGICVRIGSMRRAKNEPIRPLEEVDGKVHSKKI